jgi:hypothetical protein
MMQGSELREMEWAPPIETAPLFFAWEDPPEEYGPWQLAGESGRAAGRITAEAFTLQEDGKLRCPAGASLWVSEVRQENTFTRAGCVPGLPDRLSAMCSARAVSGPWSQRQSCSSRECGPSTLAATCRCGTKACYARTNALGGCSESSTSSYLDCPLASTICRGACIGRNAQERFASPAPSSCCAFASSVPLARSARPQCLVWTTTTACQCRRRSCLSSNEVTQEELATTAAFARQRLIPLRESAGRESSVSVSQTLLSSLPRFSKDPL